MVASVTGSSRGIGRAISEAVAAVGAAGRFEVVCGELSA